ncbi:MAG: alpha/beta hydrolase [Deltaproteobacteria bacterium]|nr:alpha/beta hydrolase [Deltaproteobacteria bacterium]
MRRWRGLKALVHEAVDYTTELVGEAHAAGARRVLAVTDLVPPLAEPARAVESARRFGTELVLAQVRAVNHGVRVVTDAGLDLLEGPLEDPSPEAALPLRSDLTGTLRWVGDAALGTLNAAVGDHLHRRDNALSLGMRLRRGDRFLPEEPATLREALARATPRVVLLVHGLGATEWSWCLHGERYHGDPTGNFGALLARDLGYTPLYARYNTGRHISENGRALSEHLERALDAWPVPVEELVLLGHSMGGLVARSAIHHAETTHARWRPLLRRVFCLGSPHQGAPLAKLGHLAAAVLSAVDTPGTLVPARILQGRSAGLRDLRHGDLLDRHWLAHDADALFREARDEVPLAEDVRWHFLAATVTLDPEHPAGLVLGDLLVRAPSASGERLRRARFPVETRAFGRVLHHELQNHPDVYAVVRDACAEATAPAAGSPGGSST